MNIQTRFCALKFLYKCFKDLQQDPTISNTKKKSIKNCKSLIESEMENEMKKMKSQELKDGINLKSYSFTGKDWRYYCKNDDYISNLWEDYVEIKEKKYSQFFSSHIINCIHELENKYFTNTEWILHTSTLVIVNKQFRYIFGDPYIIEDFFKSNPVNVSQVVKDAYEQQLTPDQIFVDKLMVLSKIEETLDNWKNKRNSNVEERFPILKEGMTAYLKEKYYLSISALIPQIEGLLKDAAKEVGLKGVICWKKLDNECLENAVNTLMEKWKEEIWINDKLVDLLNENFPKVIAYLYKEYDSEIDEENQLNRHGVCHGIQTNFGIATSSLRLILIIDRIIFFMADEK